MTKIALPWPPKELLPNARPHWAAKARATKTYKSHCGWHIHAQGAGYFKGASKYIFTFCPPDKRRRDLDGMLSSFKPGIDAISAISGIDDSKFEFTVLRGDVVINGIVLVEILT